MAQLVSTNDVDVFKIVDNNKINIILEAIETNKSDVASVLKAQLGDVFSFSEIRYGINYWKFLQKIKAD